MIKVSDLAKEKASQLMKEEGFNPETDYIRVGVKSGGCSGLEYVLKFDNEKTEADQVFEDNGVKIVVDKKSFLYLVGTTLEFSGGLNGKGFVFNNPNAARGKTSKPKNTKLVFIQILNMKMSPLV